LTAPHRQPTSGWLGSLARVRRGPRWVNQANTGRHRTFGDRNPRDGQHPSDGTALMWTTVECLWTTLLPCPVAGTCPEDPARTRPGGIHRATGEALIRWGRWSTDPCHLRSVASVPGRTVGGTSLVDTQAVDNLWITGRPPVYATDAGRTATSE
jgi:hypothetical protein